MDPAAQLRLSNIPRQRAVTLITRTIRIVAPPAIPITITTLNRHPILILTIAQIARFVRQFRLRESWLLWLSSPKSPSKPASLKRPNVQIQCLDSASLSSAALRPSAEMRLHSKRTAWSFLHCDIQTHSICPR
jgi:hypothetical protein